MMVIDFGFDDNKTTIGTAYVDFYDAGWKSTVADVTVKPTKVSSTFPSGWVVGVEGVYGWDAIDFIEKMSTTMAAGPFNVTIKRDARVALTEMRATFEGAK